MIVRSLKWPNETRITQKIDAEWNKKERTAPRMRSKYSEINSWKPHVLKRAILAELVNLMM